MLKKLNLEYSKLPWHEARVRDWLAGKRIAPITLDMALTRSCTFNCQYCYSKLQKNPGAPLSIQQIRDFYYDCGTIGVKGVSLVSDGESTCNEWWKEAILIARENGLDVGIGTNGFLFEPLHDILAALTYLRFNLSAAEPDAYAEVHGTSRHAWNCVLDTIRQAVRRKQRRGYEVTIGLQALLLPELADQVIPLVTLGVGLGVDYVQLKHTSDDEKGSLGIDYDMIRNMHPLLERAERIGNDHTKVIVKWHKICAGNQRSYARCYAPPFHLQISGSGLIAPCGMLFNPEYKKYHIGSLHQNRFIDIFQSKRYWEVMDLLASESFNAQKMCGCLCLQDASNIWLSRLKENKGHFEKLKGEPPAHVNFL